MQQSLAAYPRWQTGIIYWAYPRSLQDANQGSTGNLSGIIQLLPTPALGPSTESGVEQGHQHHGKATAGLSKPRAQTSTSDGPAQARRRWLLVWLVVLLSSYAYPGVVEEQPEDTRAEAALRIVHPFTDADDPLSDQEIIEYQNKAGLSLCFRRKINKPVCLSEKCRPLSLYIVWDGAGYFQGIELLENEPLTKTDHTNFTEADYNKLHRILSDESSVLGSLAQEDLIRREKLEKGVDAYSGATRPSLYEQVVRDAVYTCYTLWHTVYGSTRQKIRQLLADKVDAGYLEKTFGHPHATYRLWSIDMVAKYPAYQGQFYDEIAACINADHALLAERALYYFTPERLAEEAVQKVLVATVRQQKQLDVIWKLTELPHLSDAAMLLLLDQYETSSLDRTVLSYVYKMLDAQHLENPRIRAKLKKFLGDDNRYVRTITEKALHNLNE